MLSLGQLRRWNEITAMQGVGRSPLRIAVPMILAGFAITAATFAMSEMLVPTAYRSQTRILKVEIKGQQSEESMGRLNVRYLGEGGVFWMIEYYDGPTKTLRNVSVQSLTRTGVAERIDAETASWSDGIWTFKDGHVRAFEDSVETAVRFRRLVASRLKESPQSFSRLTESPFQMNMPDLKRYAQKVRASGSRDTKIWVDYHLRLSFPFATVIMVLLGASLSLRIVRGSHLALGIGATLFLGFAYWTLLRAGQSLGYTGALPPVAAAWLANLVFGGIGLVLFWKVAR
jgi:lipopolysaccharide export system permease protein